MRRFCAGIGLILTCSFLGACSSDPGQDPPASAASEPATIATAGAEGAAIPSLQATLDERRASFSQRATPETKAAYEQGVREVATSGVMESALDVGDAAPDFTLPGPTGAPVHLADLLRDGPVVLTWYRGGWCPYCNIQLQAMQDVLPRIRELGASLVAISPETPDHSLDTQQKNNLEFHVLSDRANAVAARYGLVYTLPEVVQERFAGRIDVKGYNGDDSMTLPLAATYVVDRNGRIAWAYVDEDYRRRAEPADVVRALEGLGAGR